MSDGFTNANFAHVMSRIVSEAAKQMASLAYGMWNPDFCAADARAEATAYFAGLRAEIDHWEARLRDSGRLPEGEDPKGLSAKQARAAPEEGHRPTSIAPPPHGDPNAKG